ncbi:MAG: Lrp/AsnC family transcriptional regulator [Desulfurococcales archaeon]|nr:Lrp/AsnC family transcriptional regulator [Desulfurococcales archaeon]
MVLDEKDLALLRLLERDSRIAWRRIARELNVSEATVYLRVRKLIDEGILRGFTIDVDVERLGLTATIFALVRVEARKIQRVRKSLQELRYVSEVYEITGQHHFLVKILAPSYAEAASVIDELMSLNGVVEVSTFTALRKLRNGSRVISDFIKWRSGGPARA